MHTIKQKTGFDSPVDKSRGFTTGEEKEKSRDKSGGNIKNFNYKYNKPSKTFKTGDTPEGGVYACKNCGNNVAISSGGFLPPCPRCGALEFVKKS